MKATLVGAAILLAMPTVALAQAETRTEDQTRLPAPTAMQGLREFTLSGTGTNDKDFNTGSFGISGSFGYYLSDNFQANLRQSFNIADLGEGRDYSASTRFGLDYVFILGNFRPFIGVNVGAVYGDAVRDTGIIGPEAGLKYYVNQTTFLQAQTEYQYFFEDSDDIGDNFDDGAFVHTVGIGFNF